MAFDSVLFEDFKFITWLGQTLTFGWVITMVTVTFETCCHGNAIDLSIDNITTRSVDSVICIEVCGNYPAGPNNLG